MTIEGVLPVREYTVDWGDHVITGPQTDTTFKHPYTNTGTFKVRTTVTYWILPTASNTGGGGPGVGGDIGNVGS